MGKATRMNRLHVLSLEERGHIEEALAAMLAADRTVTFAYLYGSFVESEAFHDVDVGVYLIAVQPDRATATALDLTQRLGDQVHLPVDVRILNGAPDSFLYHVLRGRLLLSRDDALLAEIMERTIHRVLDIAPLRRQSAKEAFAA